MKQVLFPALISVALAIPAFASTTTTPPPAATAPADHHHTAADIKAACEKRISELKSDKLTGDHKALFDAKIEIMKTTASHMDKFSSEKSGVRAAHDLGRLCKKIGGQLERMLKRAEKDTKKAEKTEVKKEEPKKEEPKKEEPKKDEAKPTEKK